MTERTAQLNVAKIEGKTPEYAVARSALAPEARHAVLAVNASSDLFTGDTAELTDLAEAMRDIAGEAAAQDMSGVSRMLTAQALSLDALFTQLARKAHINLASYPDAAERYMRMAFKAQAQSRATLEALVKLHQPREQTVRHIHVGPDGQAVFIENLHGGLGSVRSDERAHAQGASGAALLGHDPLGNGMPIAGGEGKAKVPHARRGRGERSAAG